VSHNEGCPALHFPNPPESCICRTTALQFPKQCSCGRVHWQAGWEELPFVGNQFTHDGSYDLDSRIFYYRTELRNCPCGSTIALEVEMEPEEWEAAKRLVGSK